MFDTIDSIIKDVTGLILGKKLTFATLNLEIKGTNAPYILYLNGKRLQIVSGVALYGGFSPDFREHDPTNYATIIDGMGSAEHVVYVEKAENAAGLDGFVITGGHASAYGGGFEAASILIRYFFVRLRRALVRDLI